MILIPAPASVDAARAALPVPQWIFPDHMMLRRSITDNTANQTERFGEKWRGLEVGMLFEKLFDGLGGGLAAAGQCDMRDVARRVRFNPDAKECIVQMLVQGKQVRVRTQDPRPNDCGMPASREDTEAADLYAKLPHRDGAERGFNLFALLRRAVTDKFERQVDVRGLGPLKALVHFNKVSERIFNKVRQRYRKKQTFVWSGHALI